MRIPGQAARPGPIVLDLDCVIAGREKVDLQVRRAVFEANSGDLLKNCLFDPVNTLMTVPRRFAACGALWATQQNTGGIALNYVVRISSYP